MTVSGFAAPVGSHTASRLSESHTYSVPVVRELPRPVPRGLQSFAW
jgi:hypothetical protein